MRLNSSAGGRRRARNVLLFGALLLAPILAAAALAPFELAGTQRATPTTMGALEIVSASGGIATPQGLTITVLPTGE